MPVHPSSDVNFDKTVDILDIIIVATAFGAETGQENWDSRGDISSEWGLIDIFDLIMVAVEFGETWTP